MLICSREPFANMGHTRRLVLEFHREHVALGEMGVHRLQGLGGGGFVLRHHPQHAMLRAIHDRQGHDVDLGVGQTGYNLRQLSRFVFEKNRDLFACLHDELPVKKVGRRRATGLIVTCSRSDA